MTPKIRFSGYDEPYKAEPLSAFMQRIMRKNTHQETDIPLTISSQDGLVDQRTYFGKKVASADMSGYYLLNRGEFAYNKSTSIGFPFGSIKRLDKYESGAVSTLYICFALKGNKCDSEYIKHYFDAQKWNKEVAMICAEGSRNHGLLNIPVDDFFGTLHYIPESLSEQQKIAAFLSAYDKKISLQKERVKKLEERKKGLLQKVFSQEIRFKADDGSEFPEWENKTIGDICDALTGFPFESKGFVKKGVRLLRGMNVKRGYIDFSDDITAFWKNTDELNSYILQENDFIIQMDGALVGKSFGLLKSNQTPALLVQRVTRLRSESPITTKYIFQYFSSGAFDSAMMLQQTNSAVPHISLNDIKRFSLPYPSEIEQRKIVIFLETIDTQISLEKEKLATMQEIKKGLLQQMFC